MDEPKKKVGRPQAEIDLEQVERLAAIDCTEPEIAAVLGIDYATWKRHKINTNMMDKNTRQEFSLMR